MKKQWFCLIVTLLVFASSQITAAFSENDLFSEESENTIAVTISDVDAEQLSADDPADGTVYNAMFKINGQSFIGSIRTASMDDLMEDGHPHGNPPQGAPENMVPEGERPEPPERPEGEAPKDPHGPFPGKPGKSYVIELKQDSGNLSFLIRLRPEMPDGEERPEPPARPGEDERPDLPEPPDRPENGEFPEPPEMPKRIEAVWTINGKDENHVQVMDISEIK